MSLDIFSKYATGMQQTADEWRCGETKVFHKDGSLGAFTMAGRTAHLVTANRSANNSSEAMRLSTAADGVSVMTSILYYISREGAHKNLDKKAVQDVMLSGAAFKAMMMLTFLSASSASIVERRAGLNMKVPPIVPDSLVLNGSYSIEDGNLNLPVLKEIQSLFGAQGLPHEKAGAKPNCPATASFAKIYRALTDICLKDEGLVTAALENPFQNQP